MIGVMGVLTMGETKSNPRRFGWIFLITGLLIFIAITMTVSGVEGPTPIDEWATSFMIILSAAIPPWMGAWVEVLSFASYYISVLVVVTLPPFWRWKRAYRPFYFILMNAWGGTTFWLAMLYYFDRVRPVAIFGNLPGYPSGHAMSMFTIYAGLLYIFYIPLQRRGYGRRVVSLWLLWALLNGFSRLYLEVHYPTDVAAGYAIGMAWFGLSMLLLPMPVKAPPFDEPVPEPPPDDL
jgi:membrane-associated phospholipid phosphatase